MERLTSESVGAFYQCYPSVAVVVTAGVGGKNNAMTAVWHTPLSKVPPLYGVAISTKRFTYQLITRSKEFGVNFLPFEAAETVAAVGGSKGKEIDKFQVFNLASFSALKIAVPLLIDAYTAYECRLVDDRNYGDHRLLVGEIVAVHRLAEAFTTDETLDLQKVNPILYLGHELYLTTTKNIRHLAREVYGK